MEDEIGVVAHYFGHINVAGIKILKGSVRKGDVLHIKGHTSDFNVTIESMQIDNNSVDEAPAGSLIGIKVPDRCREHDKVYKVT